MSKKPFLPKISSVCADDQNQETQEFNGGAGASFTGAVFNLSTTIVGAGIMALPGTMKVLGLGLGVLVIVLVALLTNCSLEMLLTLITPIFLAANFIPSLWDVFQFTGATSAVWIRFIFPSAIALRDPHGVATRKDKIVSCFMIFLAVFSSLVAIYSDARAVFSKKLSSGV